MFHPGEIEAQERVKEGELARHGCLLGEAPTFTGDLYDASHLRRWIGRAGGHRDRATTSGLSRGERKDVGFSSLSLGRQSSVTACHRRSGAEHGGHGSAVAACPADER